MLPLYLARIEDLGLGDFVKVDCAACPHVALLTPARSLGLGRLANPLVTDQSPELTLDDARKLYEKFADKDGGDAVRVMAQIALWGKRQQIGTLCRPIGDASWFPWLAGPFLTQRIH